MFSDAEAKGKADADVNGSKVTTTKETSPPPGAGWTNGDVPPSMYPITRDGRLALYSKHRRWIGLQSSWSRIGKTSTELDTVHSESSSGATVLSGCREEEARTVRALVAQLCETFYHHGWATGTGGGVSIRVGGPKEHRPYRVFVAPSGVQKEDVIGEDVFELDMDRNVVEPPTTPNLRQSACTPLWYVVYRHVKSAMCVIHTHSMNAQLATLLDPTESAPFLRVTHLEMLKGVGNHSYDSVLEIPIIDNRPSEDLLATQLEAAILKYPKCNAVLVRRHGLYAWGDSWEQAKAQCESFDYLFESAVRMKQMGMDPGIVPAHGTYREEKLAELARKRNGTEEEPEDLEKAGEEKKEAGVERVDEEMEDGDSVGSALSAAGATAETVTRAAEAAKKANTPPPRKRQRLTEDSSGERGGTDSATGLTPKASGATAVVRSVPPKPAPEFNASHSADNAADLALTPTTASLVPRDSKILLLDIEGTTTSISFVKDVLFPYILTHLEECVAAMTWETVNEILNALTSDVKGLGESHAVKKELSGADVPPVDENGTMKEQEVRKSIGVHVRALMRHDVKSTGLKALQGRMWKSGYHSGELVGHAYDDFLPTLLWCNSHGVSVNIYSSGSIGAQKLLFGHTEHGDVTSHFHAHFDTTSGSKKEAESYRTIAKTLLVRPGDVVFVSDLEAELVAAREAGMMAVMSVRPGNAPLTDVGRGFSIVRSLLQLCGS